MGDAEKLSSDLLEAMSGGVDQMTDGLHEPPKPEESGVVVRVLSDARDQLAAVDFSEDNRPLTPSLFPKAASAMMHVKPKLSEGFVEGEPEQQD